MRAKLHHFNVWPWVMTKAIAQNAIDYKDDPPEFWNEWISPLRPINSDGMVGGKSRCGKEFPIARFAPSNEAVTCGSCVNGVSLGIATEITHAEIDELPGELQYLKKCDSCSVIVEPEIDQCVRCVFSHHEDRDE